TQATMSLSEAEEGSTQDESTVELDSGSLALANNRILQTIANREINIVNPCLITSDANVGPLVEVLLNVPKDGDSNLINIPDTDEEEDRTKDASIQSCEEDHNDLNELPKLDTEKEK